MNLRVNLSLVCHRQIDITVRDDIDPVTLRTIINEFAHQRLGQCDRVDIRSIEEQTEEEGEGVSLADYTEGMSP